MTARMHPTVRGLVTLAAALAVGCAHAPTSVDAAGASEVRERVLVTGSRIPRRPGPDGSTPLIDSPVRVIERGELQRTGLSHDLAAALWVVEPGLR